MNTRIAFLLLLLSVVSVQSGSAESNLRAGVSNGVVSHRQRRELSWWSSILYLLLHPGPHPPGSSPSGSGSGYSGSSSTSTSESSSGSSSESGSGSSSSSSSGSSSESGSDNSFTYQDVIEGDTDGITNGEESYYLAGGSGVASPAGGGSWGGDVGVFAYIVAALVATVIGAAMVAMWKKRQAQKDEAVAPLGRFVEISSVRSPGSYSAPKDSARAARGSARV